MILHPKAGI